VTDSPRGRREPAPLVYGARVGEIKVDMSISLDGFIAGPHRPRKPVTRRA
jgi:hypothetical protein